MTQAISAAKAKARLSEIVAQVAHAKERYIIERHGKPVAAVVSIEDLNALEAEPVLRHRPAGALALVGAWQHIPDEEIDAFVAHVYRAREREKGRPVQLEP